MKGCGLIFVLTFLFFNPLFGQLQKVFHQTFEIDTINQIHFDQLGEYKVESWAGNNIMTETKVKLYQASEGILDHLIEAGRYELEANAQGESVRLSAKDKLRRPIKTHKGECAEIVELRIFIPDSFEKLGEHGWKRPNPDNID